MVVHKSPSDSTNVPILWRDPFPLYIHHQVGSRANPQGNTTNSDMELAGTIGHDGVLANLTNITHLATCSLLENILAVAWRTKGRTTTTGITS